MRQLKIAKSITNRQDSSLDKYLSDVSKYPLISTEEEVYLAKQIKEGDMAALDKLARANLRFVISVAKQYQNQGLSLPDLINEGNLGLLKACTRFDESRGFKFISYAVWWIRQSIIQAIAETALIVRLPLNQIGSINKVKRAMSQLEQVHQREPSAEEVAEITEISEYKIEKLRGISRNSISLDEPESEYETGDSKSDFLAGDEKTDRLLIFESLRTEIRRSLSTLAEKERDVLTKYYGLEDTPPMTLEEIGAEMDLTRERVRQIKEKGIRRLKHSSRSKLLKSFLNSLD